MKCYLVAVVFVAGISGAFAQQMDPSMPIDHSMPMAPSKPTPKMDPSMPMASPKPGQKMDHSMPMAPSKSGQKMDHSMPKGPSKAAPKMDHSMPMSKTKKAGKASPAGHDMKSMNMPMTPGMAKGSHKMGAMGPMAMPVAKQAPTPPPSPAFSGPAHAADRIYGAGVMGGAREELRSGQGDVKVYKVLIDRLETQFQKGGNGYRWDAQAWYGGDINRIWVKTEGSGIYRDELEKGEVQALWSRAILPFFDLQAGVRYDFKPTPTRTHFALGIQGLMPYFFEVDAAVFLSTKGELTARMMAEYDQRITQRLIIQPRAEINLAAVNMPDIGIGSGLSSAEAGLRLRYEFVPEFAPYIGVEYERKFGTTADYARASGEDVGVVRYVTGLRVWF